MKSYHIFTLTHKRKNRDVRYIASIAIFFLELHCEKIFLFLITSLACDLKS